MQFASFKDMYTSSIAFQWFGTPLSPPPHKAETSAAICVCTKLGGEWVSFFSEQYQVNLSKYMQE